MSKKLTATVGSVAAGKGPGRASVKLTKARELQ